MNWRIFLLPFILLITHTVSAQTVCTQQQFEEVLSKVRKGDPASVTLLPGTYHLSEPLNTKSSMSIAGYGSTITCYSDYYGKQDAIRETSSHFVCKLKHDLDEFSLMVDQDGTLVEIAETVDEKNRVNITSDIIGNYEKNAGVEIRIPIPANLSQLANKHFQKAFGYFDCGWVRMCFKLKRADNKYLYCETLHTMNVSRFDYEKTAYKNDIRFVIYNAEIQSDAVYYDNKYIYIPKTIYELKVKNCNVFTDAKPDITLKGDVSISGVTFDGINGVRVNSNDNNQCSFVDCKFTHTLGTALTISKKSEQDFIPAFVTNCKFDECSLLWGYMLNLSSSYTNRKSIHVADCEFVRYPDSRVRYKNTSAMVNVNADVIISNCKLWNTCRCHLYFTRGNSEAVGNVIYNTPEFNAAKDRNLSNDWGLIYVNHVYTDSENAKKNTVHKVTIENCFLSGAYAHANDARGVMIDNGRGDVVCRNNVVLDCQCYSLDARETKSFVGTSSIRNVFENNVLGCRYRLAGGVDVPVEDRPVSKGNVLLAEYKNVSNDNSIIESSNTVLQVEADCNDGKMYVGKKDYKKLKKLPVYKHVKKYLKKK